MPRYPKLFDPIASMPGSVFAKLAKQTAQLDNVYPFWGGDLPSLPPEGAQLPNLAYDLARPYKFSSPAGSAPFVAALVQKLRSKNGLEVSAENVQVTAGATQGLFCAARSMLDPGDEMLILSPYWHFLRGHALAAGATPVEVPFSTRLAANASLDPGELIERYITPKTSALYFANPNNPDGRVYSRSELETIAEAARRHDLWVISDEVYEEYVFEGEHVSIATLPGMFERTLTTYSFTKSYAMGGLRLGYVACPPPLRSSVLALTRHSMYHVPWVLQLAGQRALESPASYLEERRDDARRARDLTVDMLSDYRVRPPSAGWFVFFNLRDALGVDADLDEVHERLVEAGTPLIPGSTFGQPYADWARLAYFGMPMERLREGLEVLRANLEALKQ